MARRSDTVDWGLTVKVCVATFVGMGLGIAAGTVVDPSSVKLHHVGMTFTFQGGGAWLGGVAGCGLVMLSHGVQSAMRATIALIILLPMMIGLASITAFPVERAIRGLAGGAIGIALGVFVLTLAPLARPSPHRPLQKTC